MKWNIFERLSKLEQNLSELREIVRHQGNIITSLQPPQVEQSQQEEPKAAPVEDEELKDRLRQRKRDWYQKNKDALALQRKAKKMVKQAEKEGLPKKAYYWKNRDHYLAYNREYYKRRKAQREAQATTQEKK